LSALANRRTGYIRAFSLDRPATRLHSRNKGYPHDVTTLNARHGHRGGAAH
jgi:hypothetical protein